MVGKVVTFGILAAVVVLIGVALFRPATLFGVDAKALANSLGGEVSHAQAECVGEGSGHWRCTLSGNEVGGVEYALSTHSFGCWNATMVARPSGDSPVDRTASGCIGLADMLGD